MTNVDNLKPGDYIRIKVDNEEFEGIVMPRPDNLEINILIIKLDSGYNIGIDKKTISICELIRHEELKKPEPQNIIHKKGLPTISILHTGGTIASRVDYRTGGVYSSFSPEDLIAMFPELGEIANITSELIASMWSDDLRFVHLSLIAKTIEKKVKEGVDGIIVGIGTDNLAPAAAALSFMIDKSPIPILLVGAQRSSDRGSSDAGMNLICAANIIVNSDFAGVAICMHEHTDDISCVLLPPVKTKKLHSSRRDAFKPVNDSIICSINYQTKKIDFVSKNYSKRDHKNILVIKPDMEDKVAILKITMNMFPEQFDFYHKHGYKGLVIEGTGLGHTPLHVPNEHALIHKEIASSLKKLADSGCIIVMTTTCLFGRVNMNVYDKGRDLTNMGIIPGEDMLPETAFVKLSWLLANHKKEEVRQLIAKNLRGEINDRILPSQFVDIENQNRI